MANKRLFVMQGLPGSGKSTYAKKLVKRGGYVLSADDFFVTLGRGTYKFDPARLSEAHGTCFRALVGSMDEGLTPLVVDNTNISAVEVAPYILAANAFGYEAEIVRILCPTQVCIERQTHGVPRERLLGMEGALLAFSPPPWWKVTEVVAVPACHADGTIEYNIPDPPEVAP